MPVIEATLLQGYDDAAKKRLCEALTDAVLQVVPARPEAITVHLHELATNNYMRGRQQRFGAPPRRDGAEIVQSFLLAMQDRDLVAAQGHLGEDFTMRFPGAAPMTSLEDLIEWSSTRYAKVAKTYEGFDQSMSGDRLVVYARGSLHGDWLDGAPFKDIRFIDRFEIDGERIVLQEVWNDLAEAKAAR